MTTHPYFVAKAREVLHRAGGDPDTAAPLAAWAHAAKNNDDVNQHGVLVARDGSIVAETRHPRPGSPGGWSITSADRVRLGLMPASVDMVRAELRRRGMETIHVRGWEVCCGASQFIRAV